MRLRAWERWQAAAGPWKGYGVCPALLAPESDQVKPRSAPRPTARSIAAELVASLETGGVLVILELEPILGLHVAALLNQWRLANAVLVLPRWPYRQAILPVNGLLDGLLSQARRLTREEHLPNVAFVLDAERSHRVAHRSPADPRADNRYRLLVSDLPDLKSLRARGIRQLVRLKQSSG